MILLVQELLIKITTIKTSNLKLKDKEEVHKVLLLKNQPIKDSKYRKNHIKGKYWRI
jgi:hypothetical protein